MFKEVNLTLKWQKKNKLKWKLLRYLFPFLENKLLESLRKSKINQFRRYLNMKNLNLMTEKGSENSFTYSLSMWHSSNYERGQVIIISEQKDESGPKPFQLMVSGTGSVDQPLKICQNPDILIHHLRKVNILSKEETEITIALFN